MLAILNSLNANNLPIFQTILVILVSKFMVHKAFNDKTNLSLAHPGSESDRTIASERQSTALATLYIGGSVTCSQKKTQGA